MISRRTMMNDEIVSKSGNIAQLEKCKGSYLNGLQLFGKSKQFKTNGLNMIDVKSVFKSEKKNGITFTVENDEIVINGTATATADLFSAKDFLLKLPAGEYTFSIQNNSNIILYLNINSKIYQTHEGIMTVTITPDSSIAYFIVRISANATFDNYRLKIMLNSGSVAKTWEPYTGGIPAPNIEYPQDISIAGDNGSINTSVEGLNLSPFVVGDVRPNFQVFESGVFINGVKNTDFYAVGSSNNLIESSYEEVPELTPGDYYMLSSSKDVTFFCAVWRNGNTRVIGQTTTYSVKISVQKGDKFRIFFRITGVKFTGKVKAMITRERVSISDYEPYRIPQKLILKTPNGLPSIWVARNGSYIDDKGQQWMCDEIDLGRGKYVQRLAYETIDKSTLDIVPLGTNTHRFGIVRTKNVYKNADAMSNFARYSIWANSYNSFCINGNQIYYGHTEVTTAEEIKQKFEALQKIEILGQLAEPVEHDLTAEEIEQYKALHTYTGTTVLSNDAEVYMKATYRKFK